jgi:hypothetical protein
MHNELTSFLVLFCFHTIYEISERMSPYTASGCGRQTKQGLLLLSC